MDADLDAALARVGGDLDLLKGIAAIFLEECPEALAAIRRAIEAGDARALAAAAHSLKGSVSNFGARAAHDAALRLEQMGRAGDLSDAGGVLAQLERALEELNARLSRMLSAE